MFHQVWSFITTLPLLRISRSIDRVPLNRHTRWQQHISWRGDDLISRVFPICWLVMVSVPSAPPSGLKVQSPARQHTQINLSRCALGREQKR
uniref:Putative secreted protein n=1 Tax=Anopheles darlingi TaxID=43151 RepID=A0A2M4DHI2_ANODA